MIVLEKNLTNRHLRFLRLIYPEGTICVGLAIGADLARCGYVERTRADRYTLTKKGRDVIEKRCVAVRKGRTIVRHGQSPS